MMKQFKKYFLLIATIIALTVSCSKDDSPADSENQNGGEIFTAEVVSVNLPDTDFNANEYQGTLGGIPVTLTVSPDNTLVFMAPFGLEGNHDLIVPALNLTIHYNLTPTTLDASPDETIKDLTTSLATFTQLVDGTTEGISTKHNIEVFLNYYANAGVEEKTNIATIYKANKVLIDQLMSYNGNTDRGVFGDTLIFVKNHTKAVAAIGIGIALVASATTIAPIVLGIACIAVGSYSAFKTFSDGVDNLYTAISIKVASWQGTNGRGGNGIVLSDGEAKTLPFELVDRKLIESDANNTEPIAQEYFTSHNLYNFYVEKTNNIIDNTNATKGTDFSDIQLEELPVTSEEVDNPINEELFSKVQFSISHPNLQLVSTVFDGDGQLKITVKIIGTPATTPVETKLNYTYDDDFSSFSGTLPLIVESKNGLIGTWSMESFNNGVLPGQYVPTYGFEMCPNIVTGGYTTQYLTLSFTETTFNQTGSDIIVNANVGKDENCVVISDEPDTSTIDNYSEDGTYILNGNTITITTPGEPEPGVETITFITPDKIKIGGDVFVRQ